jgi:hypothetical protein
VNYRYVSLESADVQVLLGFHEKVIWIVICYLPSFCPFFLPRLITDNSQYQQIQQNDGVR